MASTNDRNRGSTASTRRTEVTTTTTRQWAERKPVAKWWAAVPPLIGLPVLFGLGMGPARSSMEDKLVAKTEAALQTEGITGLQVTARGRDIHLNGPVSAADLERVHNLARTRVGVRHVFDPDGTAASGAPAANSDLSGLLGSLDMDVTNTGGKLVLRGKVATEELKSTIGAAAAALAGAANVTNELEVDATLPAPSAIPNSTQLVGLGGLVQAFAGADGDGVSAHVGASGVTLTGEVASAATKTALGDLAAQIAEPGGTVDNQLTVGGSSATSATPTTTKAASTTTAAPGTTAAPSTTAPAPPATTAAPATTAPAPAVQRFVVYFDTDLDTPLASSEGVLSQATAAVQAAPAGTKVSVVGFADLTGDVPYNVDLSRRRAERVHQALVTAGPNAAYNVSASGVDPAITAAGDLGQARRVEITIGG